MVRSRLEFLPAILTAATLCACGHADPAKPSDVPTCSYTLSWTSRHVAATGGQETLDVTTGDTCAWTAASAVAWATVPDTRRTGAGSVVVTIGANADPATRTGTLTVAGLAAALQQDGATPVTCTLALSEPSQSFGVAGGDGGFDVAVAAGCGWDVVSPAGWITIADPASHHGAGNARVRYSVAANAGGERHDDIRVGDRTFRVNQAGINATACTYTVTPTTATFHWHDTGGNFSVATADGCQWSVHSAAGWLTFEGAASRTGDDTLRIVMSTYTDETPRRGAVELRWPAATAGQNVWVTQEGCFYALVPSTATVGAAGGLGHADLMASPSADCMVGCPWTVTSHASWLHPGRSSGTGDDLLSYTVDGNTGAERTGVIEAMGHTLTVTQAGP